MSVEDEIRVVAEKAVEAALKAKGGVETPILALLVGGLVRPRDQVLIDALLGFVVGAAIDSGTTDEALISRVREISMHVRAGLKNSDAIAALAKVLKVPYGDPKTMDYCKRCGQSPNSATHMYNHIYEDPRVK